jgi:hypothetical protein
LEEDKSQLEAKIQEFEAKQNTNLDSMITVIQKVTIMLYMLWFIVLLWRKSKKLLRNLSILFWHNAKKLSIFICKSISITLKCHHPKQV